MSVLFIDSLRKMMKEMNVAWDLQTALEMQEKQIDTLVSKLSHSYPEIVSFKKWKLKSSQKATSA